LDATGDRRPAIAGVLAKTLERDRDRSKNADGQIIYLALDKKRKLQGAAKCEVRQSMRE